MAGPKASEYLKRYKYFMDSRKYKPESPSNVRNVPGEDLTIRQGHVMNFVTAVHAEGYDMLNFGELTDVERCARQFRDFFGSLEAIIKFYDEGRFYRLGSAASAACLATVLFDIQWELNKVYQAAKQIKEPTVQKRENFAKKIDEVVEGLGGEDLD